MSASQAGKTAFFCRCFDLDARLLRMRIARPSSWCTDKGHDKKCRQATFFFTTTSSNKGRRYVDLEKKTGKSDETKTLLHITFAVSKQKKTT